jgi:hypothetical protein
LSLNRFWTNVFYFGGENMKVRCWKPSKLSQARIWMILFLIWLYHSSSWRNNNFKFIKMNLFLKKKLILSTWKLTLGYGEHVKLVLVLGISFQDHSLVMVKYFKKIHINVVLILDLRLTFDQHELWRRYILGIESGMNMVQDQYYIRTIIMLY